MDFKIIWSAQAREDLRDVVAFIAQDNPQAAALFGHPLISKVEMLSQFPQLGRMVPEEQDEYIREIIFRPYRIIYQFMAADQVVCYCARLARRAR